MSIPMKEAISFRGRFFRRLSKPDSDWSAQLVQAKSMEDLPISLANKKEKGKPLYVTVVGYSLPEDTHFDVMYNGEWVENGKYGLQLKVKSCSQLLPTTKTGIVRYLSSRRFKGIGKSTASLIVDEFGEDTLSVLRDTPDKLLRIRGITKSKLEKIERTFRESESYNLLAVYLGKYDIPADKINAINNRLGSEAMNIIAADPYAVCDVPGVGFPTAEAIAKGMNDPAVLLREERVRACILYSLWQDNLQKGHLYSVMHELQDEVMKLLNTNAEISVPVERYDSAFDALRREQKIIVRSKTLVYSKAADEQEQRPAHKLVELLGIPEEIDPKQIDKKLKSNKMLSEKQKSAVRNSLVNRVSVITGGPGTGKTTILKCLIGIYEELVKKPVTLLAPTGRAARRMAESTGRPASTVHSAIHLYQNDLEYGECVKLEEGLIVIDEMSMVDQFLMDRLMGSLPTDNYHVVMVGDVDQLESVGAGSVLRELIASEVIPVNRLTEVFRQSEEGAIIVDNATAINTGNCLLRQNDRFVFVQCYSEEDALNRILSLYESEVREWGIDNVAILCPLRHRGMVCVDNLNKEIQEIINPVQPGEPVYRIAGKEFRLRDRVIMTKNTEFASNGDIGILEEIVTEKDDEGPSETYFHINWDNGVSHDYFREEMDDVDLAYAITIHKSQGSEYASCIIPILSAQEFMLRRNLFYTAVTRSKNRVHVVYDRNSAVQTSICRNQVGKRNTMFGFRLKSYASTGGQ